MSDGMVLQLGIGFIVGSLVFLWLLTTGRLS